MRQKDCCEGFVFFDGCVKYGCDGFVCSSNTWNMNTWEKILRGAFSCRNCNRIIGGLVGMQTMKRLVFFY